MAEIPTINIPLELVAAPLALEAPPAPVLANVSQKPWYIAVAALVKNFVVLLVAFGYMPQASSNQFITAIMGAVAAIAVAVGEGIVLAKYITATRATETQTAQAVAETMRWRAEEMRLRMTLAMHANAAPLQTSAPLS